MPFRKVRTVMKKQSQTRRCFISCVVLLMMCSLAIGQGTSALRGTVTDMTGAVVPGVQILLQDVAKKATYKAVTDGDGSYQFPQLDSGKYRLTAELKGFTTIVHDNLQIRVNTTTTLPLSFGAVTPLNETIDVNSADATIGNTIQSVQIDALPSDRRDIGNFTSLQAGVVHTGIEDKSNPDTRSGTVTGARSDQSNITLDGVDVNDQQTGEAFRVVVPVTLDSIQEVRTLTANAPANQGRSSGGQVSLVTRSGGNAFHGSVYEYHRNTVTSANTFFNNSTVDPLTGKTLERPKLIRNIFGASLGGPIKKDGLFFFFNFEDTITRREEPQLRIVPTQTLRDGILQYRDSSGAIQSVSQSQLQAMDPLHIGPNQASLALFRQYPVGNDPTQGDGGLNFIGYRFNGPLEEDKPSYIGRIDYVNADARHRVFIRGNLAAWKEYDLSPQFPGQPPARNLVTTSKGMGVGHTWIMGPTLINTFRWGLTRQSLDFSGAVTGPGLQMAGITNIQDFDNRNMSRILPTHNITDDLTWIRHRHTLQFGVNYRNIHNKQFAESGTYPYYRSNDNVMRNAGRDVLPPGIATSFRTQYIRAQMALLGTISQVDATYYYDQNGVLPVPHVPRREFINGEFEWYVQDQWKVRDDLTVTVGLRYSYYAPPYEKDGLQVRANFDVNEWFSQRRDGGASGLPSNTNPVLSFVPAGKANDGAASFFDPDKNNFAPRVAVAWRPSFSSGPLHAIFGSSGQSSIRSGVAVFYDRTGGTFPITTDLKGAVGLANLVRTPSSTYNYDSAPRFNGLENLMSIPLPPAPPGGFPSTPGFTNNTGFMVDSKLQTPYSITFNFSITRALSKDFSLEAAYIGRVGRKLLVQNDFAGPLVNFRDPVSGQTWTEAMGIVADLVDQNVQPTNAPLIPFVENVFAPMATATTSASREFYAQMRTNAPDWINVMNDMDAVGNGSTIYGKYALFQQQFDWLPAWTNLGQSSYHSLQLTLRKRFTQGLQADFNYTLAKSLDNGSAVESEGQGTGQILNAFDHRQSLGYSNFDIRHQFNTNFVMDLPFGRNQRWAANMSPTMNGLVGGWRLTGILRWHTGFPFDVRNSWWPTNYSIKGPATLKPGSELPEVKVNKDASGGPNIFGDPTTAYTAFQATRSGFSGNRNLLHGPGFFTLDTGVQKAFKINDRHEIQFRWETFNLTNTANFDGRPNSRNTRGIDSDLNAPTTFGRLRSLAGSPRVMQFVLRYQF